MIQSCDTGQGIPHFDFDSCQLFTITWMSNIKLNTDYLHFGLSKCDISHPLTWTGRHMDRWTDGLMSVCQTKLSCIDNQILSPMVLGYIINFKILISILILLLNHVISVDYWLNLLLCVSFCRFVHRFIELEGLNCLLDFLEKMDFETRWVVI